MANKAHGDSIQRIAGEKSGPAQKLRRAIELRVFHKTDTLRVALGGYGKHVARDCINRAKFERNRQMREKSRDGAPHKKDPARLTLAGPKGEGFSERIGYALGSQVLDMCYRRGGIG